VTEAPIQCSAKGCRQPATWTLHWSNPKIHTGTRQKTWLACDTHRDPLATFLEARHFLRSVTPHPEP
jgi:hypothetical protein